jgi:hypothetical protein
MSDSLLVALRSYRPRPGRDALEDFVTEAFAWTLGAHPTVGRAFLDAVCDRAEDAPPVTGDVEWTTQASLDGAGIADMIARQDGRTVLFEHKVWSRATAKQVERYRCALEDGGEEDVVSVLITGSRWNYTGPQSDAVRPPDVRLTWADVYRILDRVASEADTTDRSRVNDFLALLDHEELGPREPLSEPVLRAFVAARNVPDHLYGLVEHARLHAGWGFAYEAFPALRDRPEQVARWGSRTRSAGNFKHGRIAFGLYKWRPGVLVGMLVDPSDIGTRLVEPEVGPDLVVYIGLPAKKLSSHHLREVVTSPAYRALCDGVTEAAGDAWTVSARGPDDATFHRWHPLVIQRPLAHVLRGCATRQAQREAVCEVLKDGVAAFVQQTDALLQLRARILNHLDEA